MKATYIDYKDTNSFSKTLLAYLAAKEDLKPFYGNAPTYDGFEKQIEIKSTFEHRQTLVDSLKNQYKDLIHDAPAVASNIDLLLQPNTFTITTGHQLNIFTGPLYFIFKIACAIRLARDLKAQFPDKDFVPVYWMASEDHDFAEINNTRVYGKKIVWDVPGISGTGKMDTSTMEAVVRQYIGMLGLSDNSSQLASIIEEAYLQGRNLADATRYLVNALFKEYGLVILDADQKELKEVFAPIIREDILEEKSFAAISQTTKELEEKGFATQVHA